VNLLNFVLNCVGLALWLSWRPAGLEPVRLPASNPRPRRAALHWLFLAALILLVLGRSWLYWRVGRDVGWVARLDLGAARLDFNSAVWERMLAFSIASFGLFLGGFFMWLLLLAAVNRRHPPPHPWMRAVAAQLGWLARLPVPLGLLLPAVVLGGLWAALHPAMREASLVAPLRAPSQLWQEAAVVGLGAALVWEYLVVGVIFAHVLNSYLYLGGHGAFTYLSLTAQNLLRPLARLPLRAGRVDFTPVVGIVLALAAFALVRAGLARLFDRLPL
jgi:uncharacterized protein YggT (Ycf19 family)